MVDEEGVEMDIEERCLNCDNCSDCFYVEDISADCDGGFQPREDIVELHGKLRKAVDTLKELREFDGYDAKHRIDEGVKYTSEGMVSTYRIPSIDKVLEELRWT